MIEPIMYLAIGFLLSMLCGLMTAHFLWVWRLLFVR